MAYPTSTYNENMTALSLHHPELARALESMRPAANMGFSAARSGHQVPDVKTGAGRIFLNSPYDPVKEAERLYGHTKKSKALLILGLDGGYTANTFLRPGLELLIVTSNNLSHLMTILGYINLSSLLEDPRFKLIVEPTPRGAAQMVLSTYVPYLHGDLTVVTLRGPEQLDKDYYDSYRKALSEVLMTSSIDCTTQGKFGLRWARNIIRNAAGLKAPAPSVYHRLSEQAGKIAHITAAGPGLESSLGSLKAASGTETIIATDTSLPTLLSAGIPPDYVVSVDCQLSSYHHFLRGIPEHTHLVADLVSPPLLFRLPAHILPVAGGHPMCGYLANTFFPAGRIDTSGGNVTHAAVSFADGLGFSSMVLHGADFAYPDGKLYARGTYLFPYFRKTESRTCTLDTAFGRMLFDRENTERKSGTSKGIIYGSPLLDSYRRSLEVFAGTLRTPLSSAGGELLTYPGGNPASRLSYPPPHPPAVSPNWYTFGRNLLREIDSLFIADCPVNTLIADMSAEDRELLATLFPLAAYFYRQEPHSGSRLLEKSRRKVRDLVDGSLHGT